jgi:hypothetical protein
MDLRVGLVIRDNVVKPDIPDRRDSLEALAVRDQLDCKVPLDSWVLLEIRDTPEQVDQLDSPVSRDLLEPLALLAR